MDPSLTCWTPRPYPLQKILEGRFVRIEPINILKHGDGMCDMVFAPDAERRFRYLFANPPKTREEEIAWLEKNEKEEPFYVIIDKSIEKIVGSLGFHNTIQEHGTTELGLYFSDMLARRPGATEAIYLISKFLFDELKYRRY